MKRALLTIVFAAVACICLSAQPRTVGLRIGYGLSFSYQHSIGQDNMISIDLDLPGFGAIGTTCTYDWIDPFNTQIPWDYDGEWHWNLGAGASAGAGFGGGAYFGIAGRVGVSYDFDFPLQLSLDWAPNIGPAILGKYAAFNAGGLYAGALAIGARYRF